MVGTGIPATEAGVGSAKTASLEDHLTYTSLRRGPGPQNRRPVSAVQEGERAVPEIDPAGVKSAAASIEGALAATGGPDLSCIGELGAHLVGSQSAAASAGLNTAWEGSWSSWTSQAERYSTSLRASATAWESADTGGATGLRSAGGRARVR